MSPSLCMQSPSFQLSVTFCVYSLIDLKVMVSLRVVLCSESRLRGHENTNVLRFAFGWQRLRYTFFLAAGPIPTATSLLRSRSSAEWLKSYKHPWIRGESQTSLKTSEIGLNQRWIATRLLQEAPEVNTGSAKSIFTALEAVISTGQATWGHDLTCVIPWSQFLCCLGLAYCATVNPREPCRTVCNHHGRPSFLFFFFFPFGIFSDTTRSKKLCVRILCYHCLWKVTNVFAQQRCNGMNINYGQSDPSNLLAWKSVSRFDLKSKLDWCVYLVLQIVYDDVCFFLHTIPSFMHFYLLCLHASSIRCCPVCWRGVLKCT